MKRIAAIALTTCSFAGLDAFGSDFTETATIFLYGLDANWTGKIYDRNNTKDMWLGGAYNINGQSFERMHYRLGPGGALDEVLSGEDPSWPNFLSIDPSATDRMLQQVLWDFPVTTPVSPADCGCTPDNAHNQYNVNQAGTRDNLVTPVVSVTPTTLSLGGQPTPQIDVYATPQDQYGDTPKWHDPNFSNVAGVVDSARRYLTSKNSLLTRYRLVGPGHLLVRRVLLVGDTFKSGKVVTTQPNGTESGHPWLTVEAWAPFVREFDNASFGFNSVAFQWNTDNSLGLWVCSERYDTWMQYGKNKESQTYYISTQDPWQTGYGVAFRSVISPQAQPDIYGDQDMTCDPATRAQYPAIAVLFGRSRPQRWHAQTYTEYGQTVFATWRFKPETRPVGPAAIGILPALRFGDPVIGYPPTPNDTIAAGGIIDVTIMYIASMHMDSAMKTEIDRWLPLIPAPRYFPPGTVFDAGSDLEQIAKNLKANMDGKTADNPPVPRPGTRTNHLYDLIP